MRRALQTPAAVRFISAEPLLGPIDLSRWLPIAARGNGWECVKDTAAYGEIRPKIGWVIVGGESGPHARPMHPDWATSLRDQCQAAGVPFFFKQWGEWVPVIPPTKPYGRRIRPCSSKPSANGTAGDGSGPE